MSAARGHLWVRAEQRANERRHPLTPDGAAQLISAGFKVTVEASRQRTIPLEEYMKAGCETAAEGSWMNAPDAVIVMGLKELPDDGTPLRHRHIMFGHSFKGQPDGPRLLRRFKTGGGKLFDLEYLTDETGRRVAAFGHWAGFAGAAVALLAWAAQCSGHAVAALADFRSSDEMVGAVLEALGGVSGALPTVLIIGALGRVGRGATELCEACGVTHVAKWDVAETASGGPFPQIISECDVMLNCILAGPGGPVFVPESAAALAGRRLGVIGDIACDPDSEYSPIKVNDRCTSWEEPVRRVSADGAPPLDVVCIDNLPSLLPRESADDFSAALLPSLLAFGAAAEGEGGAGQGASSAVWSRALALFEQHAAKATAAYPARSSL